MANVYWPGTGFTTKWPASGAKNWPSSASGKTWPAASTLPQPPGAPIVWFDPQDIDLSSNGTLTDGASIATWKNKGSLGSAWDALQATGATQPTFKKVSAAGKINNLSSVISNGSQWMQTALQSARPSANFIMALGFKCTSIASTQFLIDGHTGGRSGLATTGTSGALIVTGAGAVTSNKSVAAGAYDVAVVSFNGASTIVTLDGSDSAAVSPSNQALTGVTLFSGVTPPSLVASAELLDVLIYEDSTTKAQIASFYSSKYGATPQ